MLDSISSLSKSVWWVLFHIILGIVSTLTPWALIIWFYFILFNSTSNFIQKKFAAANVCIVKLIVYLSSFEILARMSSTSPFVPYELGKYLVFILLLLGIFIGFRRGRLGIVMILLLIPGIVIGFFYMTNYLIMIFDILGTINIALAVIFFYQQKISVSDFWSVIRLLIYPLVSVLFYTLIKTPDLSELDFNLSANFATTGGFGTNQVSTVLGAATFFVFLFIFTGVSWLKYKWLQMSFLVLFVFQGLLSFSRGGMLGGFFAVLLLILAQMLTKNKLIGYKNKNFKPFVLIIVSIIIILFTFRFANEITGGNLLLRYQGETNSTLSGYKEKDLNSITTNRFNIFMDDIDLFLENSLFGVGVSQSREIRKNTAGISPHTEMSRLLAEHGVPGLIFFILLLYLGFELWVKRNNRFYSYVLVAFYFLALYTTFHAATRTYFTPLMLGLSLMHIVPNKRKKNEVNPLSRQ